jgi:hypothetical protein
MGIYDEFLVYVQIDTRNVPEGDTDTIVTITTAIVGNTVVRLEFQSIIRGVDSDTVIYRTNDVESAFLQTQSYLQQIGLLHLVKLAWSTNVFTFTNPTTSDFNHAYINIPED